MCRYCSSTDTSIHTHPEAQTQQSATINVRMRPAIVFKATNSSLPPDLLEYDGLDAFKHHCMMLPSLIFSGFLLFLQAVSNIMWARCQRNLVLHLKRPLHTSKRAGPTNDDSRIDLMAVLVHLSMYIDHIEVPNVGLIVTWELLAQALIASMIPLVIPSRFLYGWPTISTGFFLCWAYIWHQHTYAWIIRMTLSSLLQLS